MLVHRRSGYHRAVPATTALRAAPERALRTFLLWLSRRRSLGRLATRLPVTRAMVARFVAGETLDEALVALEKLREAGLRTTVDVLGEDVAAAADAAAAADEYLAVLDALAARVTPSPGLHAHPRGHALAMDECVLDQVAHRLRQVDGVAPHG